MHIWRTTPTIAKAFNEPQPALPLDQINLKTPILFRYLHIKIQLV
jgi:hypothetical protein